MIDEKIEVWVKRYKPTVEANFELTAINRNSIVGLWGLSGSINSHYRFIQHYDMLTFRKIE